MPRLFIGIKITTAKSFENIYIELKKKLSYSNIKWVDPENFHLTLKFLGEVDKSLISRIIKVLDPIAGKNPQFCLESKELGFFGRSGNPRIIWYGFEQEDILLNLQSSIETSLKNLGFAKEKKGYSPHLTLGRVKKFVSQENLKESLAELKPANEKYNVTRFSLVESILRQKGPEYRIIKDFCLKETKEQN